MTRAVLTALLLALALAGRAAAQDADALATARAALDAGDFLGADTALDRGLAASSLDHARLIELYEVQALLAYADDRLGLLEQSLDALAMLREDVTPPIAFPPPLAARYAEIAATEASIGLTVELVTEVVGGRRTVRIVPRAENDRGRLVRSLRVEAGLSDEALRPVDSGTALDAGDPRALVDVHYRIEAIGPGGVVVASRGTPSAPLEDTLDPLPVDETFLHVTLATVASVVLVGAVAFGMTWLATDGFTTGQPTTIGSVRCEGAACASAPLLSF